MIQTLEDMIRRFCAYGLEFKYSDGFIHDWCTLIPALELEYKTYIHSSTGKTPAMLEKGLNPRLTYDTLKKDLVDIQPKASSFKLILDKARHHENRFMQDSSNHAKESWDKSPKPRDSKQETCPSANSKFQQYKRPKEIERFLCRTIYDKGTTWT
ncbi:hypothetical protein O181_086767 [Austropuccinia psidii MF-1]|uniref:Integrase catalytic domain-containing protein n=1 Tax=Austropuccinia psidii MF-1 TaxID=1389203 RepID=A0A9Q3G064_9BASI|nr:hypothetical protein [Austropuccinia psidii MF-1]